MTDSKGRPGDDRREQGDRRTGPERRKKDRRVANIPVEVERRSGVDRRTDRERRTGLDRRKS